MNALVWTGVGEMVWDRSVMPTAAPDPGWAVLKVAAVGVCGSELSAYLGHNALRHPPLIMGHEFSGYVAAVGSEEDAGWIGHLVTANPLITCGSCRWCRMGQRQLCQERRIVGIDFAGAFADTVHVPISNCWDVADAVDGSLVEPLACAYRAVHLADVKVGDTAVVFGAGIIGLMCTRVLAERGCEDIMVVEENPDRLAHAQIWGGTSLTQPGQLEQVARARCSGGVDVVIDAVGVGATRVEGLKRVRRGGQVIWIGLHEEESTVPANAVVRNEVTMHGSFCYSDDDFARAVNYVNGGHLPSAGAWLDVRPRQDGGTVFAQLARGGVASSKIVLSSQVS